MRIVLDDYRIDTFTALSPLSIVPGYLVWIQKVFKASFLLSPVFTAFTVLCGFCSFASIDTSTAIAVSDLLCCVIGREYLGEYR